MKELDSRSVYGKIDWMQEKHLAKKGSEEGDQGESPGGFDEL